MPPTNDRPFGARVKNARLGKDMTLRELARRIEKSPSYVNDIEYNRRVPSEAVVRQLCEVLELDVDQMLAAAGRVGDKAEEYLRREPQAGVLFRKMSEARLGEGDLQKMMKQFDRLAEQRRSNDRDRQ
jgi:transcriptional regulator with XRE-family HTH domain